MRTYAIIPARYNSTRFPGKPLALINKQPMFLWVYHACNTCHQVDKVILATDDLRIQHAAESAGCNVILTGQAPSGTDRVYQVCKAMNIGSEDLVVNVQGDEPLTLPWHIESLVSHMRDNPRSRMVTLATHIGYDQAIDHNVVKVVTDHSRHALYFSRLPIPHNSNRFLKHLGIYAYRMSTLSLLCALPLCTIERAEQLEQLRALDHGINIDVLVTTHDTIAVDTPPDIARVEAYLNRQ
jgi:3-deoxy-manno-octulosonate cytidylyltransferase (CMP-KDO synthetase)